MPFNLFSGDPQQQAMLALTAGLLESGGPSRMPVGIGQGIARGMMEGRQAYLAADEAKRRQAYLDMQRAQFDEAKQAAMQRQAAIAQLSQDPRFAGLQSLMAVDPGAAIKAAFPEAKVVGNALVNPAAPQTPLFQAPEKKPDAIQQYEYAKGQGYKGTFQDFVVEQKKAGATQVTQSVGGKEADKKFAEEFIPFATGGFADAEKQINQLKEVSAALGAVAEGRAKGSLTGPFVGSIPEGVRALVNPESQAAQDAVEEVVQRNLRLILGAQFTEKEGARLVARAYNPKLGEVENKKRVDRLINQIETAAKAKLDASRYFMAHGTLDGWKGKLWTMQDFNPEKGDDAPKVNNVIRYDAQGRRIK